MEKMKRDTSSIIIEILTTHSVERLFNNVKTKIDHYTIDGNVVISTITDSIIKNNCYVVSFFALIISYSRVELYKVKNKALILIIRSMIFIFSFILRVCKVDRIQILNNIMLSTNFLESFWDHVNVQQLRSEALHKYPDHVLAIRSVNLKQNKNVIEKLAAQGWIPIVTRQVYIFEKVNFNKRDLVRDQKLLISNRYTFVEPHRDSVDDYVVAESLYNQLYLKKYTEENIQYTALYMRELHTRGALHLRLLKDNEKGIFVGVVGIIGNERTLTAPIVGYDLERPVEDALYRRCLIYIITYAHTKNILLNISSGASQFKMNRGGLPEIEYTYIYTTHLSFGRRLLWRILSFISLRIYKPILVAKKL